MDVKHDILCIGELLIDFICSDVGLNLVEGIHFVKKAGGAPANVAATVAKLGGRAAFVGKVGNDAFGVFLKNTLEEVGVDTSMLLQDTQAFTTQAYVSLQADGERDFIFQRGADGLMAWEEINQGEALKREIFHFGSATAFLEGPLQSSYEQMMKLAKNNGKFISFDPNFRIDLWKNNEEAFIQRVKNAIPFADFVKVSDEELVLITGKEDIGEGVMELHTHGARIVAVTLGKKGVYLSNGLENAVVESIEVASIDSTGAGDAFVGGFLYGVASMETPAALIQDFSKIKAIASFANGVGAITCTKYGAIAALPTLAEVENFK